ncbi:hypothetical protein EN751_05365 [Mesorhizobium sp. M4A.F.Ca.ET.029.04.2.1]|nr:hypothetical protein EN751_05365 [Mesorhizobium sp. M4A.F.Ca.ET.029.04.2.1]
MSREASGFPGLFYADIATTFSTTSIRKGHKLKEDRPVHHWRDRQPIHHLAHLVRFRGPRSPDGNTVVSPASRTI